jgi:hypothetical protein
VNGVEQEREKITKDFYTIKLSLIPPFSIDEVDDFDETFE